MRKTLPNYNDGAVFVFEKVMNKLNVISTDQKFQEDRFNQRIKKLEDENEVLEVKLKHRSNEVAKLDKQFKQKMVRAFINLVICFWLVEKCFIDIILVIAGAIL